MRDNMDLRVVPHMKIAALLLCGLSLFAQTPKSSAFDKPTLEAYLRHVELWLPQVEIKIDDAKPSTVMPGFFEVWVHASYNNAVKDFPYYISKDGRNIIKGDIYDITKSPFQSNIDELKAASSPSFGPANAPVTIFVFSDFQCPYCKEESQILRTNVATTFKDKVRVVFKDFPLDAIHPWAHTAALAGRCVYRQNQGAFWDFFDWAYANQTQINVENVSAKIQEFAKDKGLDGLQLGRCIDSKSTEPEVAAAIAEGHSLQVSATPTIFLNGRKLEGGVPWQSLEALINIELDAQTKVAKADEKCCEVNIPTLVK
jgi:protein-disulfide isomerase